ncbi:MAG: cupin domain-containing protein [Actinobacteria bacterium]|jgi:mannose-6-phosphate isomerase-like protein (cupin superfamily)|nr:MAG: cupin domain-containing protein [Actinomycetota bacterium]
MAGYTKVNLRDDVDDQGPNFGFEGKMEARMARVPLELEQSGVSLLGLAPNFRIPFAHRHKTQEEVYVLIRGSVRVKLEDEVVDLKPYDALRVHKDTTRGFEAGPEGAEMLAVGAPHTGPGDADMVNDWWTD